MQLAARVWGGMCIRCLQQDRQDSRAGLPAGGGITRDGHLNLFQKGVSIAMHDTIRYIKASEYEEAVLRSENVVLDFYSTECPPCEALAAKFEPLSKIYGRDITFL